MSSDQATMEDLDSAQTIAALIIEAFKNGKKLLICGNGGSASMSQHFAAEMMCKFEHPRDPLPAIALTTDTSFLTALPNDFTYGFSEIFSRQIQALGQPGDVLVALSTSGKSENVLRAIEMATVKGLIVIDFPRKGENTARIQEYQLRLMHDVCHFVEGAFLT